MNLIWKYYLRRVCVHFLKPSYVDHRYLHMEPEVRPHLTPAAQHSQLGPERWLNKDNESRLSSFEILCIYFA